MIRFEQDAKSGEWVMKAIEPGPRSAVSIANRLGYSYASCVARPLGLARQAGLVAQVPNYQPHAWVLTTAGQLALAAVNVADPTFAALKL